MSRSLKPTILLCWPYYREDWIKPFIRIRDSFNFIFLAHMDPNEDKSEVEFERIYYNHFNSATELLAKLKPTKVVFMSIDTGYGLAMNIAAKNRKIPTYILQHGLFHNYSFYRELEKQTKYLPPKENEKKNTLSFFIKSIPVSKWINMPRLFFFFLMSKTKGVNYGLKNSKLKELKADHYIVYTRYNASIYNERDRVPVEEMLEIGNPNYDEFNHYPVKEERSSVSYFLLIDQPFLGNRFTDFKVSEEDVINFYHKLNDYCIRHNSSLWIKLHPESYSNKDPISDPNITFLRDAELTPLIMNSKGCFGTFSTALIPAIYYKNCCIFKLMESQTFDDLLNSGMVQGLDFYNFKEEEIRILDLKKSPEAMYKFEKRYFYQADGNAHQRLKEILLN